MIKFKLLINHVNGEQKIIEIEESGSYFDQSRILWDERHDGKLPNVTLGKMARNEDGELKEQADFLPEHAAWLALKTIDDQKEENKKKIKEQASTELEPLKDMSAEEIEAWAESNLNTTAQLKAFNKKLLKILISKELI